MVKKNPLSTNKKVKKKNQIPEYYALSPKKLIKIICKWLINEKPFNSVRNLRKKIKRSIISKKPFNLVGY